MFLILFLHGPFTPKEVDIQSVHYCKVLQGVIQFFSVSDIIPSWAIYTERSWYAKYALLWYFIKKLIFQCIISSSCKKITLVSILV